MTTFEISDGLTKIYSQRNEQGKGSSINFSKFINKLYDLLLADNTTINDKLSICIYILDMYNLLYIKQNIKDKIIEVFKICVMTVETSIHVYKNVINCKDMDIKCELCKFIHLNQIQVGNMIYIYKTILINIHNDIELRNSVVDKLLEIFLAPNTTIYDKMIISDVLLTNGYADIGNDLIDRVRQQQDIENENRIHRNERNNNILIHQNGLNRVDKPIYKDTQTVHNTDINNSVLNACINLINDRQKYECKDLDEVISKIIDANATINYDIDVTFYENKPLDDKLKKAFYEAKDIGLKVIFMSLDNIIHDPTFFRVKGGRFTLYNVFASLYDFIINSSDEKELLHRLSDEMVDMYRYCSTGYMARLMNVIQGYTSDYKITISDYTRTKAVVHKQITDMLNENSELMNKFIDYIYTIENDVLKFLNSNLENYKKDGHSGEDVAKSFCNFIGAYDKTYMYIDGVIRFDYENYNLF